jgi:hypothetical protein
MQNKVAWTTCCSPVFLFLVNDAALAVWLQLSRNVTGWMSRLRFVPCAASRDFAVEIFFPRENMSA